MSMLLIRKPRSFGLHVSYLRGIILDVESGDSTLRGRLAADGDEAGSAESDPVWTPVGVEVAS